MAQREAAGLEGRFAETERPATTGLEELLGGKQEPEAPAAQPAPVRPKPPTQPPAGEALPIVTPQVDSMRGRTGVIPNPASNVNPADDFKYSAIVGEIKYNLGTFVDKLFKLLKNKEMSGPEAISRLRLHSKLLHDKYNLNDDPNAVTYPILDLARVLHPDIPHTITLEEAQDFLNSYNTEIPSTRPIPPQESWPSASFPAGFSR